MHNYTPTTREEKIGNALCNYMQAQVALTQELLCLSRTYGEYMSIFKTPLALALSIDEGTSRFLPSSLVRTIE